jgi:hypothetical protein
MRNGLFAAAIFAGADRGFGGAGRLGWSSGGRRNGPACRRASRRGGRRGRWGCLGQTVLGTLDQQSSLLDR